MTHSTLAPGIVTVRLDVFIVVKAGSRFGVFIQVPLHLADFRTRRGVVLSAAREGKKKCCNDSTTKNS
jgi:hypothetical protein